MFINPKLLVIISMLLLTYSNTYSTDLAGIAKEKPIKINGKVSSSIDYYKGKNRINSNRPINYRIGAEINLNLFNIIDVPFSIYYINEANQFNKPEFSNFGLSPNYKFITLHLGFRNLSHSKYTLNNLTFLGSGVELKPNNKPFEIETAFGYLINNKNNTVRIKKDSVLRQFYSSKITYKFRNQKLALSVFHCEDLKNKRSYIGELKENNILGIRYNGIILKKINYTFEFHNSLITNNKKLPAINNNSLFNKNVSSVKSYSYTCEFNYKIKNHLIGLSYDRIEPDFSSLGTYYLNNDNQKIKINSNIRLTKKIRVNGSLGYENDNLDNSSLKENSRIISLLNVNTNISNSLSLTLNYSNFKTENSPSVVNLRDTFNYVQTTNNLNSTFSYSKNKSNIIFNYNYQIVDILNENGTQKQDEKNVFNNINLNYTKTINEIIKSLNANINYSVFNSSNNIKSESIGPTISIIKEFLNKNITSNLSYSFIIDFLNKKKRYSNQLISFNTFCKIKKNHKIQLSNSLLYKKDFRNNNSYNNYRMSISYNYVFKNH